MNYNILGGLDVSTAINKIFWVRIIKNWLRPHVMLWVAIDQERRRKSSGVSEPLRFQRIIRALNTSAF